MTDKSNNRGFFGRRVTNWCLPPSGPPKENLVDTTKALPSTVDGKSRMEGIPNPWFTGPPKVKNKCDCCEDTIKEFPKKHFIESELDDFEKWLKEAEPWSDEHTHIIALLSMIISKTHLPEHYRVRAITLIKSSVGQPLLSVAYK